MGGYYEIHLAASLLLSYDEHLNLIMSAFAGALLNGPPQIELCELNVISDRSNRLSRTD